VRFDAFDAFFSEYDEYQPLKRGKPHTRLTPGGSRWSRASTLDELYGSVTFDEWGIYGNAALRRQRPRRGRARLPALRAHQRRAHRRRGGPRHRRHRFATASTGGPMSSAPARWSTAPARGAPSPQARGRLGARAGAPRQGRAPHPRPAHHGRRGDGDAIDGRQIFIEPWGNTALIGTTDDDTYADLDDLPVTTDEVRYLVEGIEQVLPRVRDARIIGVTVGARPSLYAWGKMEDALSREHEVVDHAAHGARASTPSSAASWRATGCSPRRPRTSSPRRWATTPRARRTRRRCQGGDRPADIDLLAARFELSRFAVERLVTRHGSRAETMLADSGRRGRMVVCSHEPVLACEVRWAAKHEYARTLLDVARRTNLATAPAAATTARWRAR
jgi:glycerol-3-phosphate dehydrogenase